MADVHDKATRSYNMSRIRSKDTKPEILVRKFLHAKGVRYRLHKKDLPGKPDIVLPKYKTVIFIHGCFWHCHDYRFGSVAPATRPEFRARERNGDVERDIENRMDLEASGWRVITVWECQTLCEQE